MQGKRPPIGAAQRSRAWFVSDKGTGRRICLAIILAACAPVVGHAGPADSYVQSARQFEKANNLRGAEIQLRNAAEAEPGNGSIRVELARVYLGLGDPNDAQAELFAAHLRGVKEETIAPLMAQALLGTGEFGNLLKNVPAGNRAPKIESLVRAYRGLSQLALGELADARTSLADAERLDPKSVFAKIAAARELLVENKLDMAEQKIDQTLALSPRNPDALELKGLVDQVRGKPDDAVTQFSAAIAANPRNIRAILDRATLEVSLDRLGAAETDIKAAQAIVPENAMALFLQAEIDAKQGKFHEADGLLDRLRGVMSSIPPSLLLAAEVKLQLNQESLAEDYLNKFVAQRPGEAKGWQLLGSIALRRGNAGQAISDLERARNLAPKDVETLGLLGQAYRAHGDVNKANDLLNQAAQEFPNNQNLQTERAIDQFASGDRQGSLSDLESIFKAGAGNLIAGAPLALEALQSGRVDVAASTAEILTRRDPGNAYYQQLLALVRVAQRNYGAAEAILQGILAKKPDLAAARRNLAQIYLATNQAPAAKKLFEDALQKNPSDTASLEGLAAVQAQGRDYAGALKSLLRAQGLAPRDPSPGLAIVALLETQKKWPDAIAQARALKGNFGTNADVVDALGRVYFQSGNLSASRALYQAAASQFPRSDSILTHYAAVLTAQKDYAAALQVATSALALDPASPVLKAGTVYLTFLARGPDAAVSWARSLMPKGGSDTGQAVIATAQVLEQTNRRADAISLVENWQARAPSGALVASLAGLYQRNGQLERGGTLLETWARSHPTDKIVRLELAQFYGAEGKQDQALAQYEWLATQTPDNPVVLNNLAWLYSTRHDPRALSLAEKAAAIAPGSGSIADTLGWILINRGDRAGGLKYLQQASASEPEDATVQYHFAVALSQTGKIDQAKLVLERLLTAKASPDTIAAARTLLSSLGAKR